MTEQTVYERVWPNGIAVRNNVPRGLRLLIGLRAFQAEYRPEHISGHTPLRTTWTIEGTRLSFLRNSPQEMRLLGRLSLVDCPESPTAHGARLNCEIVDKWCDGRREHPFNVKAIGLAVGTALALEHGLKQVCVERDTDLSRFNLELISDLGYDTDLPSSEFVLRQADYLQSAGVGGYTGSDYLGSFIKAAPKLISEHLLSKNNGTIYAELVPLQPRT